MENLELKEMVLNVLNDHRTGILSTVENNKPHSRYMTFYNDYLTLYSPTKRDTEKIGEIEKNQNVSVLLGYEEKGQTDSYVQISGKAILCDSPEVKSKYWNDSFSKWFDSPEDPNYLLIKINPEIIRVLNLNGEAPQELILEK